MPEIVNPAAQLFNWKSALIRNKARNSQFGISCWSFCEIWGKWQCYRELLKVVLGGEAGTEEVEQNLPMQTRKKRRGRRQNLFDNSFKIRYSAAGSLRERRRRFLADSLPSACRQCRGNPKRPATSPVTLGGSSRIQLQYTRALEVCLKSSH